MGEVRRICERCDAMLPNGPPWDRLTHRGAIDLLCKAALKSCDRGDKIEGDLGIVLSGTAAVECELFDGRRILASLFHTGNLVDLRSARHGRRDRLIALIPTKFLSLDAGQLDICLAKHADVTATLVVQLRDHMARMRAHATDLVSKTPMEKLASLLFEFARWPNTPDEDMGNKSIRIPIPRTDIADYIGVKPETVSRAIRQLEREGLIDIPEIDRFVLADIVTMRRIANGGRPRQSTRRM